MNPNIYFDFSHSNWTPICTRVSVGPPMSRTCCMMHVCTPTTSVSSGTWPRVTRTPYCCTPRMTTLWVTRPLRHQTKQLIYMYYLPNDPNIISSDLCNKKRIIVLERSWWRYELDTNGTIYNTLTFPSWENWL